MSDMEEDEAGLFGSDPENSTDEEIGRAFRAGNTSSDSERGRGDAPVEQRSPMESPAGSPMNEKPHDSDDEVAYNTDGSEEMKIAEPNLDDDESGDGEVMGEYAALASDDEVAPAPQQQEHHQQRHQISDDSDEDEEVAPQHKSPLPLSSDDEQVAASAPSPASAASPASGASSSAAGTPTSVASPGGEDVGNLFGDADDISSDEENKAKPEAPKQEQEQQQRNFISSDEEDEDDVDRKQRKPVIQSDEERDEQGEDMMNILRQQHRDERGEDDEDETANEPAEVETTRIEVEIPKISTDLGSKIHFVRFPNFLSVESRPFDPAVYEDEIEEDEMLDEEGRTRLKLKVENTIRWRKFTDENGIDLTESNARIVRWSDDSMSLHLGSEIFDVSQMSIKGDHNHLFIRQGTGLQGQAVFKTKLSFRPHSTKSATHKKMTSRLAMRHSQNQQKVRVLNIVGQDPESRKEEMMKKEEEELKAHMRREAQARRVKEKAHARGVSNNYMDDPYEDEEGSISVSNIKNRFKSGMSSSFSSGRRRPNMTDSSDTDSDADGGSDHKTPRKIKSSDESDENDDDFGVEPKRRKMDEGRQKSKKTYVVSDDDEEEESDDSTQSNNKRPSPPQTSNQRDTTPASPAASASSAAASPAASASPDAASSAAASPAAASPVAAADSSDISDSDESAGDY